MFDSDDAEGGAPYLLSVRMRASREGRHLGGAERLVQPGLWLSAVSSLQDRALRYGGADQVHIGSDIVGADNVARVAALPVSTSPYPDIAGARREAQKLLQRCGVPGAVAKDVFRLLDEGPGPGRTVMRGAMLIHTASGQRLEPDPSRGVRVSRMDYTPRCREILGAALAREGLTSPRTMEAIGIATKALWCGVMCELCWSDDPGYVAGYVASAVSGYRRFAQIKRAGLSTGGRALFLRDHESVGPVIERLEKAAVLIDSINTIEGLRYP